MKTSTRRLPATPLALAAALLTAFLVMFAPLSASAHDSLVASSPEADGTVETLPTELTLTFSADLIAGGNATEVVVTDPSGASVTSGAAAVSGATVTQPLTGEGPAGGYHVIWRVVSSDGHATSEEFDFTVTTSTVSTTTEEPTAAPTAEPTATATPEPTTTVGPDAGVTSAPEESTGSSASAWIWGISIAGIAIAVGVAIWLSIRRRRGTDTGAAAPDSDTPAGR
ncbi:copper resistance CopC family protein [Microbacterium foliorum]|uniref:Copper resistance protein C n=1 Tax=Microbacterium foliorum TaxID=104336 RepID=A0A0F0KR67_9MICO|nr:copper resistance CopC family protein [Microbacterium foliorum]KJL22625.1 Copper resistance protein C precursor [Microbacterium foliorum]